MFFFCCQAPNSLVAICLKPYFLAKCQNLHNMLNIEVLVFYLEGSHNVSVVHGIFSAKTICAFDD